MGSCADRFRFSAFNVRLGRRMPRAQPACDTTYGVPKPERHYKSHDDCVCMSGRDFQCPRNVPVGDCAEAPAKKRANGGSHNRSDFYHR
jgi:hypothetical protein